MRRAAKVDANHRQIRTALRQVGWTVHDLSGAGNGIPDLLCLKAGRVAFVEVKDGSKVPSARKLTPDQVALHEAFTAAGTPVHIVTSVEEAIRL